MHSIPGDHFFLEVFSEGRSFLEGSIAKQVVSTGKTISRVGALAKQITAQTDNIRVTSDALNEIVKISEQLNELARIIIN